MFMLLFVEDIFLFQMKALHAASRIGQIDIVRCLAEKTTNIDSENNEGVKFYPVTISIDYIHEFVFEYRSVIFELFLLLFLKHF